MSLTTGRRLLLGIALTAAAGAMSSAAARDEAPYNVTGRASMSAGLEKCTSQAFENAKFQAVVRAIGDITHAPLTPDQEALAGRADDFITRGGIRKARDSGNGFCQVNAGLRIDLDVLRRELRAARGGSEPIAVVARFRINGDYVGDQKINPQLPTDALASSLQRLGCRAFSLDEHHDRFATRLRRLNQIVTGDDGVESRQFNLISFAEALYQLIIEVRHNLLDQAIGSKRAGDFNMIAIADVNVELLGDARLHSGRRVQASATLTIRFADGDRRLDTDPIIMPATGNNDTLATRISVQNAMEVLAREADTRFGICSGT